MKIGFSFSLCINDIVAGNVEADDVLVIITRTRIDKVDQIDSMIDEYFYDRRMFGDKEKAKEIGQLLYTKGKLHQPRLYSVRDATVYNTKDVWMDLAPTNITTDENVVAAWKDYQMLLRLTAEEKIETPGHLK